MAAEKKPVKSRQAMVDLYSEWVENDLNDIDASNAVIDGADATGNNTSIATKSSSELIRGEDKRQHE